MKLRNTGRRYRSAFTLVELLVVIGIIALLAAILLPAMNLAMKKADKVRAQNEMASIVAAIKAYYNDYGKMPAPPGDDNVMRNGNTDYDFGGKWLPNEQYQSKVMWILRGSNMLFNGYAFNPNKTVYLDVPIGSLEGTDIQSNRYETSEGYFLDPWGNPYQICMDTDFDGVVKFTLLRNPPIKPPNNDGVGWNDAEIKGQKVCVFSYGPPPHELKDVLNSWGGDAIKENP